LAAFRYWAAAHEDGPLPRPLRPPSVSLTVMRTPSPGSKRPFEAGRARLPVRPVPTDPMVVMRDLAFSVRCPPSSLVSVVGLSGDEGHALDEALQGEHVARNELRDRQADDIGHGGEIGDHAPHLRTRQPAGDLPQSERGLIAVDGVDIEMDGDLR